jgi:hypothetical protein
MSPFLYYHLWSNVVQVYIKITPEEAEAIDERGVEKHGNQYKLRFTLGKGSFIPNKQAYFTMCDEKNRWLVERCCKNELCYKEDHLFACTRSHNARFRDRCKGILGGGCTCNTPSRMCIVPGKKYNGPPISYSRIRPDGSQQVITIPTSTTTTTPSTTTTSTTTTSSSSSSASRTTKSRITTVAIPKPK